MIVLDCSAAINIVQGSSDGEALVALIQKDELVISSELFLIEAANALGRYSRAGVLDYSQAASYMFDAVELVDEFVPLHENYLEALHESQRLGHSAYDLVYLSLARRNAATLVTLDRKLNMLCEQQGVECISVLEGFQD